MVNLTPQKKKLLDTDGHILALGGPGSGKTYIALLKADQEIRSNKLLRGQSVLFLSFARATIARVEQQARKLVTVDERRALHIDTYHGFAWSLLRSHGYLLNGGNRIRLLPPPEAAAKLAEIDPDARAAEKFRLFEEEGLLHFDLFATMAAQLLSKSQSLARIICDAHPLIVFDEFQDTNSDEWELIRTLGKRSRLIALADAEQRIYEFRGADPKRISEFIAEYKPAQFDFGAENHRSNGTDISIFGNDLLSDANKTKQYKDVSVTRYQVRKGAGLHLELKLELLKGMQRLQKADVNGWSIALLVPTKRLMIEVSDYLETEQHFDGGRGLPRIAHEVALETTGPCLAAVMVAALLEGSKSSFETAQRLIHDLCSHIRGRRGNDPPSQAELDLVGALDTFVDTGAIKGAKRKKVAEECKRIADQRDEIVFSGDPLQDWISVRRLLEGSPVDCVEKAAEDAKYLRLLHKGAVLRSRLGELWRTNGTYKGAEASVRDALLQEHFAASTKTWIGVHVMTIHKAKGKEFDEVIIYEGSYQGRIVRANATDREIAQARLALRVAVTRAMRRATILTPKRDPCRFL